MIVSRVLFILSIILGVFGQDNQLKFDHLTVEDGLSEGAVYSILKDSRDFMWFGTRFGLNRYDGLEIRVFSHDPEDSTSLPGYWISALLEDSHGNMWVGTEEGGLGKYNRDTEAFTQYRHNPDDPGSLSSNLIACLFEDAEGSIWVGTISGLNKFHPETNSFEKFFHLPGDSATLSDNYVTALAELSGGNLIIGFGSGSLAILNIQSGEIRNKTTGYFKSSRSSDRAIKAIIKDLNNDYVWLTRFGYGLVKYDLQNGPLKFYEAPDSDPHGLSLNFLYSPSQDSTGKIWMGSVGGLTVFDPGTESFSFNWPDQKEPRSLNDNMIYSAYVDNHGIVWAGSEAKGLNIHRPNQNRFELFQHDPEAMQTPSANSVYDLAQDSNGDIWFATIPGGVNRYNPTSKTYRYYQTDDSVPGTWSMNYPQQVLIDRFGMLWVGTNVAGLMEVDPESGVRTKLFYPLRTRSNSISGHTQLALLETRSGTIWAGTKESGLSRYNRETNDFTRFLSDPDDPTRLRGERVYALHEDRSGILWVGTAQGGLSRFNADTETFTTYMYTVGSDNCIGSNSILAIYEDSKQNLWIGTRGGGLNKLDSSRQQFSTLDLGSENIDILTAAIEEDDHGYLWISTNKGIIKADPEKGLVNRYTSVDGLQGSEFYHSSSLHDSQGYLYFGGPNGFNRFHPDSIVNNPHIPPVVITEMLINYEPVPIGEMADGRSILTKSITETSSIVLGYQDKTISFTYAALDYTDPTRNRYAYMLENFDQDWVNAGSDHSATYTSLAPGEYTFRVKATNNDGLWNETGLSLAIQVLPPFWQSWWFRLILSFTLIIIVIIYIQLRLHRSEVERRKLEKLVVERTAELKLEIEERQRVETEKMQLKVDHLKRELVSKSVCATQKQEIMNNLFQELKDIQKMDANEMRTRFNRVVRYFKDMFKSEDDWEDFEKWFTEVHTGFFSNLRQEVPALSQSEVKVCALLRLNLVSKDIANLMNVQLNTVDIYRHRIRKKIGLKTEENLNQYLTQF